MEVNFPKLEKKILSFWKENKIFERSISQRKKAKGFVFYDGPITVNAKPGIHHVLARIYKDIIPRFKTMQGFRVERKNGWDTHGLPVELEVEKELGFKTKRDIEKYGIAKFNEACKKNVQKYIPFFKNLTEKIGYWVDMENPYITYKPDYIESVWWILKEIWEKGLLYEDYKVSPYCPRCGTTLSSHEVALGYERIKEPAIYVKLRILNPEFKNSFLLVWTTTPWTLPGNVAVAINPNFVYSKIKVNGENLILAKERIEAGKIKGEILEEFKGKDLITIYYEAPYPIENQKEMTIYKIIPADFVSLEEGTGLVHIAPAFGEEDMELIKAQNSKLKSQNQPEFPILLTVDEEGKFRLNVKKWAGLFVKDADPLIIEDLKNRNLILKEEIYEHDYPFCWRCNTPLLYYAKKSWFIRMIKVKEDLINNNKKINWIPSHLKEGRFGEWLREIKDWALSRERFWGTPLPIWQCKNCGAIEVIGGKKELAEKQFSQNQYFILRHGQTIYQTKLKEKIYPWPERLPIKLTKAGEKQIEKIAKKLRQKKIDLIFSSDMTRAKQTAEIVARELNLKIIFDKRLRDINLGVYQGGEKQTLPKNLERFYKKLKKGENWDGCRKRMVNFLKAVDKKYSQKNILIISHGDPLWLLEGAMKGLSDKELLEINIKEKHIKAGELRDIAFHKMPLNEKGEIDFHRPYIDEVKFFCPKCHGLMVRAPEVIDCWFDSGSMPFAQYHYPFENKKLIDQGKQFPADYIAEAIDQTRGWFYTLHAISTLVKNSSAYKNVISLGHVLDEKGEKMSKSRGNVVDPWYIVEKYGADATRWYFYTVNQPSDAKLFSERDVENSLKKLLLTLWNSLLFYDTYSEKPKVSSSPRLWRASKIQKPNKPNKNILDKWIISKLNQLILEITNSLNNYDVTKAGRLIEDFVINDLSLWYIRRSRRRFQKPEGKEELKKASQVLGFVLLTLSKLTAPFVPFLSEYIYHKVKSSNFKLPNSVHLDDWPKADKKMIDKLLNKNMEKIREIVTQALAERVKVKIKVRQALNELQIVNYELTKEKALLELIKEEVNVKQITFGKKLELDIKITPELKEEGIIREVIRHIQEMRKKTDLKPKDKILVRYFGSANLNEVLNRNKEFILKGARVKNFFLGEKQKEIFDIEEKIKVDQEELWLAIKKI